MAKQKKRADGRYCKNVTIGRNEDGSLKRKMVYANTQKELDLKVSELLLQAEKGIIIDDKNMTVDVWADKWLETYKSSFKPNTVRNHANIVKNYIKPIFKGVRLKDLKQYQVQKALNDIEASSVPKRFLITLKQMLDCAVENDYIAKNVAKNLKAKDNEIKEKQALTSEQISKIKNTEFLLQDICIFLLYTGLRINELINLTWQNVDLKEKKIKITGDVKTKNSNRTLPMFEPAFEILKRYENNIRNIDSEKDYIFLWDGNKCDIATLSNYRLKYIKMLGFHFTYHQLRHTFATICYNAGIDIKQTQEWLGHGNFNTTMNIYTHLDEQNKKTSTEKMNEFLKSV